VNSALYEGTVHHARFAPVEHRFQYRIVLAWLDLAELDTVFAGRWLWSTRRPNLVWFRRADYLGPADLGLDEAVRVRVESQLGSRPSGPIRMLTQLRTLGYVFNPVTFYYCYEPDGVTLHSFVAEITNTPWGERHAYVLSARDALRWSFAKDFHVSPFFGMDQVYRWSITAPGETLDVAMSNEEHGQRVFTAALNLRRQPIRTGTLLRALVLYPWMPARAHLAIYWQALRLSLKRVPFFTHPKKRRPPAPTLP
jgi:DUF1365 family protein